MQTSEKSRAAKTNHRKVQTSTTLSRKYVSNPTKEEKEAQLAGMSQTESSSVEMPAMEMSPMVQHFNSPMPAEIEAMVGITSEESSRNMAEGKMSKQAADQMTGQETNQVQRHPMQNKANAKLQERKMKTESTKSRKQQEKKTARELKEQAIQKALATASSEQSQQAMKQKKEKVKKVKQMHFGFGRIMLATACAAAAVFAIVYFVNLNMPDISMRVAAMQTGINPSYPNYVPRDYGVSSITSEEGKITLVFDNSTSGGSFTLVEENSSWDSNALLSNFVKEEYGENYTIVREQGLTIYISGSNAAWVNGGIVYKIKTTSGSLTNKQIRSIAVSL